MLHTPGFFPFPQIPEYWSRDVLCVLIQSILAFLHQRFACARQWCDLYHNSTGIYCDAVRARKAELITKDPKANLVEKMDDYLRKSIETDKVKQLKGMEIIITAKLQRRRRQNPVVKNRLWSRHRKSGKVTRY